MEKYIINKDLINIRIDKILPILNKNITRVMSQKLIVEGNVTVNGKSVKNSYKTDLNDIIEITFPEIEQVNIKPQNIPIEILYEDKDIIVVNKPKGMVVHPANGNPDGTLVNALMNICERYIIRNWWTN